MLAKIAFLKSPAVAGAAAALVTLASGALALVAGCSSSSNDTPTGPAPTAADSLTYSTGAAVPGLADMHCAETDGGVTTQLTSASACHLDGGTDPSTPDYGDTMYGSSGSDDDCKYHVRWTSSTVSENADVYFKITATEAAQKDIPLTGASPLLEVFLDPTHPAPNTNQAPTEESPGVYVVGPVRFDATGKWTVRFHFDEECSDLSPESPHGHAAFFVAVPLKVRALAIALGTVMVMAAGSVACNAGENAFPEIDVDAAVVCPNDLPTSCVTPAPSYAADVAPVLGNRCETCHAEYAQYAQVYRSRSAILDQVYSCRMPITSHLDQAMGDAAPSSARVFAPLPAKDRASLLGWLSCNAPEN